MQQITLLHTSPPYSSGTVVQTTHPVFLLHDTVEVSWPLNPVIGAQLKVVLTRQKERYLADWVADDPGQAYQFTYAVITQLPTVWRPLR
ncbi:hypothetical protein [Deinococcus altitudinis]|uniref:hypothetical protein n=1 Tax=Deinococcus altitudinis TaxID=468914 RepID=UPI00389267FE